MSGWSDVEPGNNDDGWTVAGPKRQPKVTSPSKPSPARPAGPNSSSKAAAANNPFSVLRNERARPDPQQQQQRASAAGSSRPLLSAAAAPFNPLQGHNQQQQQLGQRAGSEPCPTSPAASQLQRAGSGQCPPSPAASHDSDTDSHASSAAAAVQQERLSAALGVDAESGRELLWAEVMQQFAAAAVEAGDDSAAAAVAALVDPGVAAIMEEYGGLAGMLAEEEAGGRPNQQQQQQQQAAGDPGMALLIAQQEALFAELQLHNRGQSKGSPAAKGNPLGGAAAAGASAVYTPSGRYAALEDDPVHPADWQFDDCYDAATLEAAAAAAAAGLGTGASAAAAGTAAAGGGGWQEPLKLRLRRLELSRWRQKQAQVEAEREAARRAAAQQRAKALQLSDAEQFPSLATLPRSPALVSLNKSGGKARTPNVKGSSSGSKGGRSPGGGVRVLRAGGRSPASPGVWGDTPVSPTEGDLHMELLMDGFTPLDRGEGWDSAASHADRTRQLAAVQEAALNAEYSSMAGGGSSSSGQPGGRDAASQEAMLSMMGKTARKQAPAAADTATSGDNARLYRWLVAWAADGTRGAKRYGYEWAQLFEVMRESFWVPQLGLVAGRGRGKHFKLRRECPASGRSQVITLPTTPSDAQRSVRSAAAAVARMDEQALAWEAAALGVG